MYERIVSYLSQQLDIPVEEMNRETTFESLHLDSLEMHYNMIKQHLQLH